MQNQIPNNWQKINLGEILVKDPQYGFTVSSTTKKIGPKLLRITDIQDDYVDWAKVPYCEIKEQEKQNYLLKQGDIVFARTGNTTGANYFIKKQPDDDVVFASYLIRIRPDQNKCLPEYLSYFFRSKSYWSQVNSLRSGSAQPGINASILKHFYFHIPKDINLQKQIISILSSFDDKIELNNKIAKTLEEMASEIFKEWFGNTVKNGNIKDIAFVKTGNRPVKLTKKKESKYLIPVYGAKEIMGYTSKSLYNQQIIITGRVGTIGEVTIINEPSWPSDNTLILIPKDYNYFYFIYFVAKRINYLSLNRGSSQPLIAQSDIENYLINLPDKTLIFKFNLIVSKLFLLKVNKEKENQKLAEVRDLLLPKLMKGEIRV